MKTSKILAFISLIGFITVSCEKDPKPTPTPNPTPTSETQKVIGTDFTTIGTYTFTHGEFVFEKQALTAPSIAEKDGTSKSELIRIYEDKTGVQKAVLKNSDGKFLAFFMRNIEDEKMEINMDTATEKDNFDTVEKAINSKYPDANAGMDHKNMKFGWVSITKKPNVLDKSPIKGNYKSTGGGITTFLNFNEKTITFKIKSKVIPPIEYTIIKYNVDYKKILTKTNFENNEVYTVFQVKNIQDKTIEVATLRTESKKSAEYIFKSKTPLDDFVLYEK